MPEHQPENYKRKWGKKFKLFIQTSANSKRTSTLGQQPQKYLKTKKNEELSTLQWNEMKVTLHILYMVKIIDCIWWHKTHTNAEKDQS